MLRSGKKETIKKAPRNPNPISPFDRIKKIHGLDKIRETFNKIYDNSIKITRIITINDCQKVLVPELILKGEAVKNIKIVCRVCQNQKPGYPTYKFRLTNKIEQLVEIFGDDQKYFNQSSVPLS